MRRISIRYLTEGALIAALYVALTWLSSLAFITRKAFKWLFFLVVDELVKLH